MLGDADELVGGVTEDGVVKTRLGVGVALGWEEADKVAGAAAPGVFSKVPHPVNAIIKRIIRPFRRLRICFCYEPHCGVKVRSLSFYHLRQ